MFTNPEIILFAVQAGIRLGKQIQRAYIDNLKRSELILPLPSFPSGVDKTSALNFFESASSEYVKDYISSNERIKELLDKAKKQKLLIKKEIEEFCAIYQEMWAVEVAEKGEFYTEGILGQDMIALTRVRQWQKGTDPNPSALQRIAGTVIEIAVDYYVHIPGALNENSSHSKALKGFLLAIDDLSFAETPVEEIAPSLFVAAIETISQTPELLTGDEKAQDLIESITKGMVLDLKEKIEQIRKVGPGDLQAEERVRSWGELIFRSVLSNAGETVLSNPAKFLGEMTPAKSEMITSVGKALMDVILNTKLDAYFSQESIDKVVKAMLKTIGEHPELLGLRNEGFRNILSQIAKDLAASSKALDPDILPEVMRLVLEKTARNLDLLWQPGDDSDAAKHLLIIASRELLNALAQPRGDDAWKPRLTKRQIMEILEVVLDEVVNNPEWVSGQAGIALKDVLEGTLEVLSKHSLSSESCVKIIRSVIKAVALRKEFIEKVPIGEDETQKKLLLALALDAVLDIIFADGQAKNVSWVLANRELLDVLVQKFLTKLAQEGVSQNNITELQGILSEETKKLAEGKKFSFHSLIGRIENAQLEG